MVFIAAFAVSGFARAQETAPDPAATSSWLGSVLVGVGLDNDLLVGDPQVFVGPTLAAGALYVPSPRWAIRLGARADVLFVGGPADCACGPPHRTRLFAEGGLRRRASWFFVGLGAALGATVGYDARFEARGDVLVGLMPPRGGGFQLELYAGYGTNRTDAGLRFGTLLGRASPARASEVARR